MTVMAVSQEETTVQGTLDRMGDAVRQGNLKEASRLGHSNQHCPLSLTAQDVGIPSTSAGVSSSATQVAKGAQATVWKTRWAGRDVAVKVPRMGTTADMQRFRKEVSLMAALGGEQHHIMPILGARALPPGYFLVMPLAGPSLGHLMYTAAPAWRPSWPQVIQIATQLATALARLHSHGVVHRDIKPDNILLSSPVNSTASLTEGHTHTLPSVLLSDLGLATYDHELREEEDKSTWGQRGGRMTRPTGGFHKHSAVGTQEYCAPELLLHSAPHSSASDVFALAVTLNELTTLTPPYSDCTRDGPPGLHTVLDTGYTRQQLAAAVAGEGLRPRPPLAPAPPGWHDLLSCAWATDPAQRPTATQLLQSLTHMARDVLPGWMGQEAHTATHTKASPAETSRVSGDMGSPQQPHTHAHVTTTSPITTHTVTVSHSDKSVSQSPGKCAVSIQVDARASVSTGAGKTGNTATEPTHDTNTLDLAWSQACVAAGVTCTDYATGHTTATHAHAAATNSAPVTGNTLSVSAGVVESMGTRDSFEDRSVLIPSFELGPVCAGVSVCEGGVQGQGEKGVCYQGSLFAVFDGHRGDAAAVLCQQRLQAVVSQQWQLAVARVRAGSAGGVLSQEQLRPVLREVVRGAVLQLEQEFFAAWSAQRREAMAQRGPSAAASVPYPGCTATIALLVSNTLTVANVGDGGALLGGPISHTPTPLTRPHTAACAAERRRLAHSGGVAPMWHAQGGGWRLAGCGLQVSRSVGDYDAKALQPTPVPTRMDSHVCAEDMRAHTRFMSQGTGLTAEPEVTQIDIDQARHQWLVLGSDGLWDVLSCERVARYIADTVKHPAMVARRLVAEAIDAGSEDNISAVVAFLQPTTTLEKVFQATQSS